MKSIHGPNSMSFLPYLLTRVLPVGAVIMAVAGFIGLGITQNIAEKKADELIARQSSQTKAVIKDRLNNIESQTEVLSRNALIINGLIDLEGRDNYLPAFFRTLQVAGHANAKIEMADYKGRRIFTNRVENGFHVKPKEWPKEIINQGVSWSQLTKDGLIIVYPVLYSNNAEGTVAVLLGKSELPNVFDVGVQYSETVITDAKDQIIYSSNSGFGVAGTSFSNGKNREWRLVSTGLAGYSGVKILTLQWQDVALASQQELRNFLLFGMVISLAILGVAISLAAYIAKRDVSGLAAIIRNIGGVHDMEQRVELSGPAELHALGNDFNKMLETLQSTTTSYQFVDSIISNTADGIITISDAGIIETYNRAAEQIFGNAAEEAIGQNVKTLMPEPDHGKYDNYLQSYYDSDAAKVIGTGKELVGQRKDGSTFPMELAIGKMEVEGAQMFTCIVRDISDRKQAEKLKEQFISTVSHELRTPLTSIKGSLGMIGSGALKDQDQINDMVSLATKNTERLINLVNDLLIMEKLQAGSMEFNFVELNIRDLIGSALTLNEPYAEEHDVRFELIDSDDSPTAYADPDRLMQVMSNLLSNAAKFSPAKEAVIISIERFESSFRVNVRDVGPGIPEAFRDRIFGRFSQADSSDTRQKGGTGLGLNISKEIVEKHGGIMGFDSEEGKGSTFYFELPERVSTTTKILEPSSEILSTVRNTVDDGSKILVLEDDPDIAKLLSMMLRENGYEVDIASSASAAKEMISATKYTAVTVDIMLPDQDGISLIRELRAEESTRNLATIVVSAKASRVREEVLAASMGIVDWLDKPIDQSRLINAVNQAAATGRSTAKPRVLHVEDDMDLCRVMTALVGATMDYVCAHTFSNAKLRLSSEKFDLAILDLGLPDGNGIDLLDILRNSDNKAMPVIIFSSDEVNLETAAKVEAALVKSNHSNQELLKLVSKLAQPPISRE